jgi:hypothetical protein
LATSGQDNVAFGLNSTKPAAHGGDLERLGHAAGALAVHRIARREMIGRLHKPLRKALLLGFRTPRLPLFVIEDTATDEPKRDQRGDEIPGNSSLHDAENARHGLNARSRKFVNANLAMRGRPGAARFGGQLNARRDLA